MVDKGKLFIGGYNIVIRWWTREMYPIVKNKINPMVENKNYLIKSKI